MKLWNHFLSYNTLFPLNPDISLRILGSHRVINASLETMMLREGQKFPEVLKTALSPRKCVFEVWKKLILMSKNR